MKKLIISSQSSVKLPTGKIIDINSPEMNRFLDYNYGTDRDKDNTHYTQEEMQKSVDYWFRKVESDPTRSKLTLRDSTTRFKYKVNGEWFIAHVSNNLEDPYSSFDIKQVHETYGDGKYAWIERNTPFVAIVYRHDREIDRIQLPDFDDYYEGNMKQYWDDLLQDLCEELSYINRNV